MDREAWQATIYGVTKSQAQLKQLSMNVYVCVYIYICVCVCVCVCSDGKASVCNAGDPSSIPGLGRSPGEENGSPLQYSCPENFMDWQATVRGVTKNQT